MKPTLTLLGFALLSFVSIHCNRSDPVASPTNHFKIEEKITIISSAAFVNLSENRFLNKMKALIFASDGITFGLDDDKKFKLMGKGPLLGLIIYSNNETTLTPGSGQAKVNASVSLNARIKGSGSIRYKGNPQKVNTHISGSGKVGTLE